MGGGMGSSEKLNPPMDKKNQIVNRLSWNSDDAR